MGGNLGTINRPLKICPQVFVYLFLIGYFSVWLLRTLFTRTVQKSGKSHHFFSVPLLFSQVDDAAPSGEQRSLRSSL